jgi:hypothetical protein
VDRDHQLQVFFLEVEKLPDVADRIVPLAGFLVQKCR